MKSTSQQTPKRNAPLGLRTVKTLCSVSIILLIYGLLNRNACFACIGAVFGMGSGLAEGRHFGGNRFVGTFVGGLVALPFYWLYHTNPWNLPAQIWLVLGLLLLLVVSGFLGVNASIQPGTVMFFVVILTVPQTTVYTYTLARILDTGIGVALSLGINYIWPSPKDKAARLQAAIDADKAALAEDEAALAALLHKPNEPSA